MQLPLLSRLWLVAAVLVCDVVVCDDAVQNEDQVLASYASRFGRPGPANVYFSYPLPNSVLKPNTDVKIVYHVYNYDAADGSKAAAHCDHQPATLTNMAYNEMLFPISNAFEPHECEVWLLDAHGEEVLTHPSASLTFHARIGYLHKKDPALPHDHQGEWLHSEYVDDGYPTVRAGDDLGLLVQALSLCTRVEIDPNTARLLPHTSDYADADLFSHNNSSGGNDKSCAWNGESDNGNDDQRVLLVWVSSVVAGVYRVAALDATTGDVGDVGDGGGILVALAPLPTHKHPNPKHYIRVVPAESTGGRVVSLQEEYYSTPHHHSTSTHYTAVAHVQLTDMYGNDAIHGGDSLFCRAVGVTFQAAKVVANVTDCGNGTHVVRVEIVDVGMYRLACQIDYRSGQGDVSRDPPSESFSTNFGAFVPAVDLGKVPLDQSVSFVGVDVFANGGGVDLKVYGSGAANAHENAVCVGGGVSGGVDIADEMERLSREMGAVKVEGGDGGDGDSSNSSGVVGVGGRWRLERAVVLENSTNDENGSGNVGIPVTWQYVHLNCRYSRWTAANFRSWWRNKRVLVVGDSVLLQMARRWINLAQGTERGDLLIAVIRTMYTMDIRIVDSHPITGIENAKLDFVHMRGIYTLGLDNPQLLSTFLRLHEDPPALLLLNPGLHDVCARTREMLLQNLPRLVEFLQLHVHPLTRVVWVVPTSTHFDRPGYPYFHTRARVRWAAGVIRNAVQGKFRMVDGFAFTEAAVEECEDGTHYSPHTYDALTDLIMAEAVV